MSASDGFPRRQSLRHRQHDGCLLQNNNQNQHLWKGKKEQDWPEGEAGVWCRPSEGLCQLKPVGILELGGLLRVVVTGVSGGSLYTPALVSNLKESCPNRAEGHLWAVLVAAGRISSSFAKRGLSNSTVSERGHSGPSHFPRFPIYLFHFRTLSLSLFWLQTPICVPASFMSGNYPPTPNPHMLCLWLLRPWHSSQLCHPGILFLSWDYRTPSCQKGN